MTTNITTKLEQLSDQTVLLILSHLSEDLREELPDDSAMLQTENEAREALASLLRQAGDTSVAANEIVPENADAADLARRTLAELHHDPALRPHIDELIANPPSDSQMSVEMAVGGAIILGALVTWLQTKVKLKVTRADGKTNFDFELQKDQTDNSIIKDITNSVKSLLTGS